MSIDSVDKKYIFNIRGLGKVEIKNNKSFFVEKPNIYSNRYTEEKNQGIKIRINSLSSDEEKCN